MEWGKKGIRGKGGAGKETRPEMTGAAHLPFGRGGEP